MFTVQAERLDTHIDTIRGVIHANDALRNLLLDPTFDPSGWFSDPARVAGMSIRQHAPRQAEWRELDHSTAVTSLYAAWEQCVTAVLTEWITTMLPIIYPFYVGGPPERTLPPNVRNAYLEGLWFVLDHIGSWDRYQRLSVPKVLRWAADAEEGAQPYRLLPEAFFTDNTNIRADQLGLLFASVGIPNLGSNPEGLPGVREWVRDHPLMLQYAQEYLNGESWEHELAQFVQARNDAAHGLTGQFLGSTELVRYATFIERLGTAVIERARREALSRHIEVASGRAELLGVVRHQFAQRRAGRCRMRACTLRRSETVFFLHERSCPRVRILGLKDEHEVEHAEITTVDNQRIGIQFSRVPPVNVQIARVVAVAAQGG